MPNPIGLAVLLTNNSIKQRRQHALALAVSLLSWCSAVAASVPAGVTKLETEPAAKPVVFSHKDWELACDNTRTCRAVGYHIDKNSQKPLALLLTRAAGLATPVRAQLMLGHYSAGELPPTPASLTVLVNGRSLGAMAVNKDSTTGELNAAQTAAVLLALPKVADVQFVSGKNRWKLSAEGAAAVLLKMDEAQGRLGTTTALVKKGNVSDDGVLPSLPIPVVQMGVIDASEPVDKRVAGAIKPFLAVSQDDYCPNLKKADAQAQAAHSLKVIRIATSKLLVSASCWNAAYNSGDGYWLVDDRPPYQPKLITDKATDYSAGSISATQKGRGLGDCWSSDEWTWNGVGFVHTSARTTGMCKLVALGGAWTLPTLVSNVIPVAK